MSGKLRWMIANTYKKFSFIDLGTLKCLSKYLFRKKIQWYFREIDSENIYTQNITNKEIMNHLPEWFRGYL